MKCIEVYIEVVPGRSAMVMWRESTEVIVPMLGVRVVKA